MKRTDLADKLGVQLHVPYECQWSMNGSFYVRSFATWKEYERFANMLITKGFSPRLSANSPCPYELMADDRNIKYVTLETEDE